MSAEPGQPTGPNPPASVALGCNGCGSPLVQPLRWTQAGAAGWELLLRCPECDALVVEVLDEASAAAFDADFDRATDQLAADVIRLSRAVFEAEIEDFAARLNAGLVLADDFA